MKRIPWYVQFITNPASLEGGSGSSESSQNTESESSTSEDEGSDDSARDQSKDFSRALAKRVAQIEAKYADYEELKAKAQKFDNGESAEKSKLEELSSKLDKLEAERDALKKQEAHTQLVSKTAKELGVSAEALSLISGDGDEFTANATKLAEFLKKTDSQLPPAGRRAPHGDDEKLTPQQRMSAAYSQSKK
ncbi:hypothetical protein [Alloscardovia sp. HMSC034E08]|uniref:hypothetical protein n=1 Tax=Alloscardovia sp. HMSC034E08 TaxID=1739413 RepID=UPI0008C510DF|nr:hypothetical protein [Alloscardovia sp. HMSC034E08]OFR01172.1 hypothetical protein HMPREF2909_00145 [Alloscardovia sp. HMSC034E08]